MTRPSRKSTKPKKIFCGQCKLLVNEEEDDTVQCDKCLITYHAQCTELDKRQYNQLISNENEEFVCHVCNNNESGVNVKSELNAIKTKLNKLNQLDEMQVAMTFMSKQFDEIIKGIAENKKKLVAVQNENKILREEVGELKKAVKFLNDNRVQNDCLISGIEVSGGTSAVESVIKLMESVHVNLNANDLEDAYVVGKNRNVNKQTVVAKFASKSSKQKAMAAKPKLMEKEATKHIFINDFLGKETLALLNHAKSLKAVGYQKVYAARGKVFVKLSESSRPRMIKNADEVDKLLLDSTGGRSRRSQNNLTVRGKSSSDSEEEEVVFKSPA